MARKYGDVLPRILDAVAQATGTDQSDLPPLYEAVDVDALDRLMASVDETADAAIFEFTYADRRVIVTSEGDITVTSDDESSPSRSP